MNLGGIHLPFNFQLIRAEWEARALSTLAKEYEAALPRGAWPNWVLGNHDRSRIATRVGPAQARVAAMLLLTLRGTLTLYYGDEQLRDARRATLDGRRAGSLWEAERPDWAGREPERTPMQWNADAHAGFSRARPWLPVGDDYSTVNVEREKQDPHSMLALHRDLIESAAAASGSLDRVLCAARLPRWRFQLSPRRWRRPPGSRAQPDQPIEAALRAAAGAGGRPVCCCRPARRAPESHSTQPACSGPTKAWCCSADSDLTSMPRLSFTARGSPVCCGRSARSAEKQSV